MTTSTEHKAGFVSIIGKPNAGKSTLMNVLVGERLSIITPKAQTTRHRILGILNQPEYQIVFSDTPGIIKPMYELHQSMMRFVNYSLEDADVLLVLHEATSTELDLEIIDKIRNLKVVKWLIINKIDLLIESDVQRVKERMEGLRLFERIIPVSALKKRHTEQLLQEIVQALPVHPPFYDKDDLSDRSERFFASEIIREKIFMNYDQEIPYSCEVLINSFKEKPDIHVINAEIIVERDSQKGIVIGKNGASLKKMATEARVALEQFFNKKVFLECHVRVAKDWRKNKALLGNYGYLVK